MGFFSHPSISTPFLSAPPAPSRKRSVRPRDDVDEFLSSDLELSFASTVSLHSPPRDSFTLISECEPMDISPAPVSKVFSRAPVKATDNSTKPSLRPRAFTSGARMFGDDVSNEANPPPQSAPLPKSGSIQTKRTQRGALPSQWIMASRIAGQIEEKSKENKVSDPCPARHSSFEDAMDVDSEVLETSKQSALPGPHSAAPKVTEFNALFYDTMSPRRSLDSSPGPQPKKRRSVSPQPVRPADDSVLSSPGPPSSPSQRKLERISSGPIFTRFMKPTLQGMGNPQSMALKRPRRLALSAMVQPSEVSPIQCSSANPVLMSDGSVDKDELLELPPARRAFSALLPPKGFVPIEQSSDESSFDGPDMSSPAQAYAKRQQVKTIRRCDGTDDFRPLTGVTAMVVRDLQESPSSKFMAAGMPGFGDNEAHGKILPCHRVKEDGLMRINCETLDDLLDGVFDSQIADFLIIDCRFDYEYNGGHISGAINIKTPTAVEEFLLSSGTSKPQPCMSGDASKKTILVFHCEFSSKRAPTFAKQLRAKDRAINNHVYPKIHYPEVYILEGGYCQYFKRSAPRCQPSAYVTMDDPRFVVSRNEDMDQFRKTKFGRHKSYTYGDGPFKVVATSQQQQQAKRNTAPSGGPVPLFAAANAARTRRGGGLSMLPEDGNSTAHSDNDDIDIGDSPCPPPTKSTAYKGKKLRGPIVRAETYGPIRIAY